MKRVVAAIWSLVLLIAGLGVVPLVLNLLTRALSAARNIERYTAEILQGGLGIAQNTASVAALKETISVAPQLVAGAAALEQHTAMIEDALRNQVPKPAAPAVPARIRR